MIADALDTFEQVLYLLFLANRVILVITIIVIGSGIHAGFTRDDDFAKFAMYLVIGAAVYVSGLTDWIFTRKPFSLEVLAITFAAELALLGISALCGFIASSLWRRLTRLK